MLFFSSLLLPQKKNELEKNENETEFAVFFHEYRRSVFKFFFFFIKYRQWKLAPFCNKIKLSERERLQSFAAISLLLSFYEHPFLEIQTDRSKMSKANPMTNFFNCLSKCIYDIFGRFSPFYEFLSCVGLFRLLTDAFHP